MRTVSLPVVKISRELHRFQGSWCWKFKPSQISQCSLIDTNGATVIYSVQTLGLRKKHLNSSIKSLKRFQMVYLQNYLLFSLQQTQPKASLSSESCALIKASAVFLWQSYKWNVPEGTLAAFHEASSVPGVCKSTVQDLTKANLHWCGPTPLWFTFSELVVFSNVHHSIPSNFLGHNQLPNMACVNVFYHLGSIFLPS